MSTAFVLPAPSPWWRPLGRADRWALSVFVAIPVVLFIVPALFGHPAIDADNLIQNFPLRVLAGKQIASGHLPLLDPLTNAGTPLLGGMNAGALYPLTVIFAFTPAIPAWIFNLIVIYVTSAVGVFVLLRWHGLRTLPSAAAALSYTYMGAMIGQIVHLGVIQGYSFLPWATVLMLALSRRLRQQSPAASWFRLASVALPWVCATALLWGLTFLTGEPRAIAVVELLTIIVVPAVLLLRTSYWLSTWRLRVAYLVTLLVGFLWGVGIGLVQLLPGWSFITFSERSQVSYSFFGAGSLAVRWTTLLFSPDLFGGNGALGQPSFFSNYNLAEVTGYAGVLALVASAAFLTRCTWKGWVGRDRDYVIYVVIGVVGLAATWGNFTPLGHIFRAIPLFGSTRLQSRNVILVDFPLAVMLGWWLDRVQERVSLAWPARGAHSGLEKGVRWITALPAILMAALFVALLGWGPSVVRLVGMGNASTSAHLASGLRLIDSLYLALALAALGAVLLLRNSRHLLNVLFAILVVDIVIFMIFTSAGVFGGPGPREASRTAAVKLLGTSGRFALVDQSGAHTQEYRYLGEPNMNVFTGLSSVQGYGALISTIYDDVTGTHPQAMVNACHLADGTFTQLRLSAIAIASSELMTSTTLSPTVPHSCEKITRQSSSRRYFGRVLPVHDIILTSVEGAALSTSPLRLQLLNGKGKSVGPPKAATVFAANKAVFDFGQRSLAAGFVVTSATGVEVGNAVVTPWGSLPSYQLDSDFQLAVSSAAWRLTSTQRQFSVFKAKSVKPEAWLTTPTGQITKIRNASWGDTWVNVKVSQPSTLKRSEAFLPGWRATARNDVTGKSFQLQVDRIGLIQEVQVPQGTWTIHFHYHAPYIELSAVVSLLADVLFLAVVIALGLSIRRRRRAKVHA
ncbi:MAG: hypothetical protein WBD82_00785 [Acidimicrobiales bacterium]